VFSVQSNATMENHALSEVIKYIGYIKLPTLIKIEETHREAIFNALKEFNWNGTNLEVIQFEYSCITINSSHICKF
jgi:hypothetical protein